MTPEQKKLYDSIVHGLRVAGWSRIEAESEALDRIFKAPPNPNTTEQKGE